MSADHRDGCHADDSDEPASTGFLPISLAAALMLCGLFVFDVIPMRCASDNASTPVAVP